MPIYEYHCSRCSNDFEKLVFGKEEVACPKCGGEVSRLMSCCSFKSGSGDFTTSEASASTGKSGCSGCSATSCSTCH